MEKQNRERLYHVIAVDDKNHLRKAYMTRTPVPHDAACVILSKIPNRPHYPNIRYMLEEVKEK